MDIKELHPDLFGGETPILEKPKGYIQQRKTQLRYRRAKSGEPTCKDCNHCLRKNHNGRNYYKCELIGESNGAATDIRLFNTCVRNTNWNTVKPKL